MTATAGKPRTRPLPPRPEPETDEVPVRGVPEILRFDTTSPDEWKPRRSVLFEIDGHPYTVLDNPRPSQGFEWLHRQRTQGVFAATMWMMEELLGSEAYDAIRTFKAIPQAGLARVIEVCTEKISGSMESPKKG